jgi:hypothetical protein
MKLPISTLAIMAACAAGCASTPVPTAQVASTETAVQSARAAGASGVPQASSHLTDAESELGKAKNLINSGDNDQAGPLLTRAEADANLAAALSREAQQKASTDAAIQRVRTMSTPTPMSEPSGR